MRHAIQLGAIVAACAFSLTQALPAIAHQTKKSGNVSVTFHVQPNDTPLENQPSLVWVHVEQGDQLIPLSNCNGCQLTMLAPDGQQLNVFSGHELQPVEVQGHRGAFGTMMIFGASGAFAVRFEGAIGGRNVNLLFPVQVRESSP